MSSCCDMMKEPSKVWGSTGEGNTGLLNRNQVPDHLRFNKYVLNYYRPATDWMGCIKSLFYLHNETVNILTHAIPAIVILMAFPWLLPWEEINIPYLPTLHVISSVAPWIGSTFYHLFMNHHKGYKTYKFLLTMDVLGIWVTQTLGGLCCVYATIYCFDPDTKQKILTVYSAGCLYCLYKVFMAKSPWDRRLCFFTPILARLIMIYLRLKTGFVGPLNSLPHMILQDAFGILGGVVGGTNIPERFFPPGKLDLLFNSHHIMHVLVVYAVYHMHLGASHDLKWMSRINAGLESCMTMSEVFQ